MLNEREEFLSYITFPEYTSKGKNDTSYLGKFAMDTLLKSHGILRVLTIIARNYMFEDKKDIQKAYRAICAWCSIPFDNKTESKEEWEFTCNFANLHNEFPELVDSEGRGWFYRHVHNIIDYGKKNEKKIRDTVFTKIKELDAEFDDKWANHVMQMQIPLFHPKTKGAWIDRFDDAIATALEQGPLRDNAKPLPDEIKAKIEAVELSEKLCNGDKKKVREAMEFLISYYIANKQPDTVWIQHPTISFDAYLGPSFSKKYLPKIPRDIITRDERQVGGTSRYKVNPEFLP